MSAVDRDPIQFITIPTPMYQPHLRGRSAPAGILATLLKVSFAADDVDLVKSEAKRLGITTNAFIRWCAIYVARELRAGYDNVPKPRVHP